MKKIRFSALFAIIPGLIVLLGYFLPIGPIPALRTMILNIAAIVAAAALILGVVNLASVHLKKMRTSGGRGIYNLFLLLSLVLAFVLTMLPDRRWGDLIFSYIQMPVETSLMAVLSFGLIYALVRLLQRRPNFYNVWFIGVVIVALASMAPVFGVPIPLIGDLMKLLAGPGARGILLGVGLGTVATGIRALIGADQPYTGN